MDPGPTLDPLGVYPLTARSERAINALVRVPTRFVDRGVGRFPGRYVRLTGVAPCPICGEPVVARGGPGRPRRYCGVPCRRRAERHRAITVRRNETVDYFRAIGSGEVESPLFSAAQARIYADGLAELSIG